MSKLLQLREPLFAEYVLALLKARVAHTRCVRYWYYSGTTLHGGTRLQCSILAITVSTILINGKKEVL